jgi:hypothetical protein
MELFLPCILSSSECGNNHHAAIPHPYNRPPLSPLSAYGDAAVSYYRSCHNNFPPPSCSGRPSDGTSV